MRLHLASGARHRMCTAARAARPNEACGLLFGRHREDGHHVLAASVAANVAADPRRRFEVDPAHLIAAQRAARNGGPAILGVWHSHPDGPPAPSAADRAGITDPSWIWIIVAPPDLAAFLPDASETSGFRPLLDAGYALL